MGGTARAHARRDPTAALEARLIGIALGTQLDAQTASRSLAARRAGSPVDQVRVKRFELLASALRAAAPQSRPTHPSTGRYAYLPFFEAYCSNFIEGTEFDVDEAAGIIFDGQIPADRPKDALDMLGTYRLVADPEEMRQTGDDDAEFMSLVRRRNAAIMEGRRDRRPGAYKELANRAGATVFVSPDLVKGL